MERRSTVMKSNASEYQFLLPLKCWLHCLVTGVLYCNIADLCSVSWESYICSLRSDHPIPYVNLNATQLTGCKYVTWVQSGFGQFICFWVLSRYYFLLWTVVIVDISTVLQILQKFTIYFFFLKMVKTTREFWINWHFCHIDGSRGGGVCDVCLHAASLLLFPPPCTLINA